MKTKDIVNIAMFATLLSVCAWIYIPMTIPFTMQTFAVFLAMFVLGGKKGTIVIIIYLFLGLIGMPVFSGGTAGPGVIFGATGGYLFGWLAIGLIEWAIEHLSERTADKVSNNASRHNKWIQLITMCSGLLVCYAIGTIWYVSVYAKGEVMAGVFTALSICVFPYIIPDLIKMALAYTISKRIKKYISNV